MGDIKDITDIMDTSRLYSGMTFNNRGATDFIERYGGMTFNNRGATDFIERYGGMTFNKVVGTWDNIKLPTLRTAFMNDYVSRQLTREVVKDPTINDEFIYTRYNLNNRMFRMNETSAEDAENALRYASKNYAYDKAAYEEVSINTPSKHIELNNVGVEPVKIKVPCKSMSLLNYTSVPYSSTATELYMYSQSGDTTNMLRMNLRLVYVQYKLLRLSWIPNLPNTIACMYVSQGHDNDMQDLRDNLHRFNLVKLVVRSTYTDFAWLDQVKPGLSELHIYGESRDLNYDTIANEIMRINPRTFVVEGVMGIMVAQALLSRGYKGKLKSFIER